MKTRQILAAAVALPLLTGVATADAAVKKKKKAPVKVPVCNIMKDPSGDATDGPSSLDGVHEANLDILSADIATNATTMFVTVRVAALDSSPDTSALGRAYDVAFTAGGKKHTVDGIVSPMGTKWANGQGTGEEDKAKKEIRFSVPLSFFSVKITPGTKITEINANSWRWVGTTNAVIGRADFTTTDATYVAGWPSCAMGK